MNILLQLTTINYKMWHSLAIRLNEIYPESKFAVILGAHGNKAIKFLREQNDINYEFIYHYHEIIEKAFKSDIDFDELRKFEESLSEKSLWRLILGDRELGSQFVHGAILKRSFMNQNNTQENILKVFSGLLKQYKSIFEKFQVDLFLPSIGTGGINLFILEQICKEKTIPLIVPSVVRVKNLFAFSGDAQLRFPQIDNTYKKLCKNKVKADFSKAEKLYNVIIEELENPQYFDRINVRFNIIKYDSILSRLKLVCSGIKLSAKVILKWLTTKEQEKSKKYIGQTRDAITFASNLSYIFRHILMKIIVTSPKFGVKLSPDQKYIYFPLHINPEYSTQVQGNMWLDQGYLIELLAKSIPFDWKVYVKEHPGTLIARTRPLSFYKKIKRLPNVCFAPIDADMHNLISNAEMVAVITGTSGWEAVQRGVPVISFADNMWDVLDLSRKCVNVETLSKDIHEEIKRIKKISPAERKKRIVWLIASMLEHAFEVTYPNQFVYTEMGTDEEYEVVGRETADALKNHLEYLQKEKGYSFGIVK